MPTHYEPSHLILEHTKNLVNEVRELRLEVLSLRQELEAMRTKRPIPPPKRGEAPSSHLSEFLRRNFGPGCLDD